MAVAALGALPAGACGCLAPTDITLDVTSDLPCSKLGGIAITAGAFDTVEARKAPSAVANACTERDGGGSFGTLVLTPSSSIDAEITVRVVVGVSPTDAPSCDEENAYQGCIVVRRVLHYEAHTPLTLPIEVHGSCRGVTCDGEGSTCVDGVCQASKIDDPSRCVGDGCLQAKLFAGEGPKGCLGDLDFVGAGALPGAHDSSYGSLSSDGHVLFAYSSSVLANREPNGHDARTFRCGNPDERSPIIGPLGRAFVPRASDASGSVMVGFDFLSKKQTSAVRWTGGKATELPSNDTSTDVFGCDRGSCAIIAGQSDFTAALWRSPSHEPILLRGLDGSLGAGEAQGVDPTGRFAFGSWASYASVWNLSTNAWHKLGTEDANSSVIAATPDGSILIGYSTGGKSNAPHAALWKAVEPWAKYTLDLLDHAPGAPNDCTSVSITDDGALISGWCGPVATSVPALWEAKSGFAPVRLSDRVAAPAGWRLLTGYLSADGAIVAGDAVNPHGFLEAYVARLK